MSGDHIRAVRNCNPLNIERQERNEWQGRASPDKMTPEQRAEKRFEVFDSPEWGFRAAAILLIKYQDKFKLRTVSTILNKWAPPGENKTHIYVERVCEMTGFGAADFLDLHKYSDIAPLIKAMATVECGGWFFKDVDLRAGLRGAGVKPPMPSLKDDRIVQASTIGGPVIGTGIVSDWLDNDHTDIMDLYHRVSFYWPKAALILVAGIGGYCLWRYLRDRKRGTL